ncbi:ABC transporter ATP-binding protein [Schleiferia thermophila]|uniref:ABC transporter family protein n=1 Tax=Schleiferia thermophila TaxID=884107 RepID=A0A369A3Y8_9FLAO|nr:ABC transporter ATP-binding protein [Schleiferia thermophila]RCX03883.1 ABC transporter family protein [Schleiferia thermophila]GCD80115.1 heme ABC exporter ATP-binding protein CcmA [Schleiferia thermophila]
MQEILLKAQNLSKQFGHHLIFSEVNFELKGPGLYAITGSNGSGKSTLLKILAGIMAPSSGQVTFRCNEYNITDEYYKHLSYAAPYQELPEELTLGELVQFYGSFRSLNIKTSELYQHFQLPDTGDKILKTFSSGMKQRVRLGLALLTEANITFLDEPTSNLDRQGIEWYQHLLSKKRNERLIIVASNTQREEYPDPLAIFEIE